MVCLVSISPTLAVPGILQVPEVDLQAVQALETSGHRIPPATGVPSRMSEQPSIGSSSRGEPKNHHEQEALQGLIRGYVRIVLGFLTMGGPKADPKILCQKSL